MTKIGGYLRVACCTLALLLVVAPAAEAKRWRNQDQDQDQGQGQYQAQDRNDQGRDYAPRDYAEPRAEPRRDSGMSMDRAVAQARREGRVLSADVVDNGAAYRIKVLTPEGRVRVLYYGAGR